MTVDTLITADLAALAKANRSHVLVLDDLVPSEPATDAIADRALLALGRMYAHRFASVVAGGVAVAVTFTLIAALLLQSWTPTRYEILPPRLALLDASTRSMGAVVFALMMISYVLALRIADRAFDRRTEGSLDRARRLVRGIDGWSVAFGIAGVVAATTLIGLVYVTVGREPWLNLLTPMQWSGPEMGEIAERFKWNILVITVIELALAMTLGRACIRRASWISVLEHKAVIPLGLVIGFATMYLGFALESLPMTEYTEIGEHSAPLRQALTISGATAVFLVITGWTLRRRRREIERGEL